MIGNDVVDITAAARESNWRRKGFLEKVFSAREREIILGARDHHQMVWLLWSMKEAAYKARQRAFSLPRILNWQALKCDIQYQNHKQATGVVETAGNHVFTTTNITSEVIHTTAILYPQTEVRNVLLETSSEIAKKEMLETIGRYFSLPVSQLSLRKDPSGIPVVVYKSRIFFDRFSFSDHGRFGAFSLSLRIS